MAESRFLFGRVILANLPTGLAPMPTSNLIYIYNVETADKQPPGNEVLSPDRLLIAPFFTNRQAWTRGYFEPVGHRDLTPSDLLAQHCFWDVVFKRYRDERGGILPGPVGICGEWSLGSYKMIDDLVSDALGVPRSPLDPSDS